VRWRREDQAARYMPFAPADREALAKRLAGTSSDLVDRSVTEYRWMVLCCGSVIGTVAALSPSWTMGYVEISYHLEQQFHRRGIGKRAVAELVRLLFTQPDLHHVFATVSHDNLASRALLESLGFRHEGTLREHLRINGKCVDQCIYGVLRQEWDVDGT